MPAPTLIRSDTLTRSPADAATGRVDAIACLDERSRRQGRTQPPTAPGRYIEVLGAERTLLLALGTGVTHIGRGLAADLRLDENSVSRRHAMIVVRPRGACVLDDRSSNGTLVNGRRIEQADLHDGDVLVLGRVVLRYLEV